MLGMQGLEPGACESLGLRQTTFTTDRFYAAIDDRWCDPRWLMTLVRTVSEGWNREPRST